MKLWFTGTRTEKSWELGGVFSTEAMAVAWCKSDMDFICPITIDKPLPRRTIHHLRGERWPRREI